MTFPRVIVATLTLAGSALAADRNVDDFFQAFTDEWMRFHTDQAASSRYFTGPEQDAMERKIAPFTMERTVAAEKLARKGLTQLRSFDRSQMSETQRLRTDIIAWDLNTRLEGAPFRDYSFPLAQNGAQSGLPALMSIVHPVVTPRDAENYVARLGDVGPRMQEAIDESQRLIGKKLTPPNFILQLSIEQIKKFLAVSPAQNALVAGFDRRMAQVKDLPAAKREEFRAAAEKITAEQIYPAWKKALALLETEAPKASSDAGIWRFPKGAEAYNYYLQRSTTTKMNADEIHQTGLRLVAEIEGRMDVLLRKLDRTEGTVRVRIDKLRTDQPAFPNTDKGRADYIAEIERLIQDAEKRGALLFDRVPKAKVVARPYPEFMGPRAPSYILAAPDGSRPGVYQFPVYGVPLSLFGLRSVVYHEAIPGHHFQGALQMEDKNLPRFMRDRVFGSNSANGEGWGLYAERLAAESGWYGDDTVGLLGQLDAAVFRARRLVVDTGLHAKRWTRQQAIDYLGPNPAGSAAAEVDRYVSNPGQACSYMIGELKFVELRERSKRELGEKFSLREFHNYVLGVGRVPLDILDQQVNRWIASKKGV